MSLKKQIKTGKSEIFRRCKIKRMQTDGTYESDWQDISIDVKKWGAITKQIDSVRLNKIRFSPMKITLDNSEGRYNTQLDDNSIWLGFANRQRTLVQIEAGYVELDLQDNGVWYRNEIPSAEWDADKWDDGESWDTNPVVFKGVISGDIGANDKNQITLNVQPILNIFREFPARNLTGFDTSMTASKFMELLRDQTDGSGSFIFRPFFNNTTTNWDIQTTTSIYANLDSGGAEDIREMNTWQVIEKLSEAENYVTYVDIEGVFRFKDRSAITTTAAFEFHGSGSNDREFGHTIKDISFFGHKLTKYYSRIEVKWDSPSTLTSFEVVESTLTVGGANNPWILGHRTFNIENLWIQTSTVANTLAQNIFNDASALKNEINFRTNFIPNIDILERIKVTYDSSEFIEDALWDLRDWGDDTPTIGPVDLIWDTSKGDAIKLTDEEFNTLSIVVDLDRLETKLKARET